MFEPYVKKISWTRNTIIGLLVILFTIPLTALAVKHQFDIRSRAVSGMDLQVEPIRGGSNEAQVNTAITFSSRVWNAGTSSTSEFRGEWKINGAYLQHHEFPGLNPGVMSDRVSLNYTFTATREYTIEFCADSTDHVTESNEDNNCQPRRITVTSSQPTPTPTRTPSPTPRPTVTPTPTTTPGSSVPAKPILAQPTNNSTNVAVNPRFLWQAAARATGYKIYLTPDSVSSWYWSRESSTYNNGWTNGSGWLKASTSAPNPPTNLNYSTTYRWKVIASNSTGSSPSSDTWKFTTVPGGGVVSPTPSITPSPTPVSQLPAPTNLTNTLDNGNPLPSSSNDPFNVKLSWNLVSGAVGYKVQLQGGTYNSGVIDRSNLNYAKVGPLQPDITYTWSVWAYNSARIDSPNKASKSFKVPKPTVTKGSIHFRVREVNSAGQPTGNFIDGATAVLFRDGSPVSSAPPYQSKDGGWVKFDGLTPDDSYGVLAYKTNYVGRSKQNDGGCDDKFTIDNATKDYNGRNAAWDGNVEVNAGETAWCHDLGLKYSGGESIDIAGVIVDNDLISACTNIVPQGSFTVCYFDANGNRLLKDTDSNPLTKSWGSSEDIIPGHPNYVSGVWIGSFKFAEGNYQFKAEVDDGVKLLVDDRVIINQWRSQNATFYGTQHLSSGYHKIILYWFEGEGSAKLNFRWDMGNVTLYDDFSAKFTGLPLDANTPDLNSFNVDDHTGKILNFDNQATSIGKFNPRWCATLFEHPWGNGRGETFISGDPNLSDNYINDNAVSSVFVRWIDNDFAAPSIRIVSPQSGNNAPAANIEAYVSDPDGCLDRVEFYLDGNQTPVAVQQRVFDDAGDNHNSWPDWQKKEKKVSRTVSIPQGNHRVRAKVFDMKGHSAQDFIDVSFNWDKATITAYIQEYVIASGGDLSQVYGMTSIMKCESLGGLWQAYNSSPFYGIFQYVVSTWDNAGEADPNGDLGIKEIPSDGNDTAADMQAKNSFHPDHLIWDPFKQVRASYRLYPHRYVHWPYCSGGT